MSKEFSGDPSVHAELAQSRPSGAKALVHFAAFAARLKKLRKNSKQWAKADVSSSARAKAHVDFDAVAARLKSCPITKRETERIFPQPVKSCPVTKLMTLGVFRQLAKSRPASKPGAGRVFSKSVKLRPFKTANFSAAGRAGVLAMAALVALLVLPGCKKEAAPETEVTVQAEHPERGTISEHITVDAILAPLAQAAIEPKITAPVHKFYVQRGTKVKEGQLLAVLENADLTAAAIDNKGSFMAAQAAYDTATKAQVPEDAQKAQLDFEQAKANLDLSQSIFKSRKELFAEGAIPGRDLDTTQAALVQAQAAYDAAAKHLESVKTVSREAALKAAQGQLSSAEGKMKGADAQVGYSEIHSPIDGVVTDRALFAGETAAAGMPLLVVMDTSSLLAKAHVPQAVTLEMKLGDDAKIQMPGVPDPVPAKVSLISPALDPGSTTVEVWLKIDNKNGKLKVGTPVKASITGRTVAQALKIPGAAVLTAQDGSKAVLVVAGDGAAHRKPVTLGIADGDDVQVISGVSASDTVITGGAYGLDEGTKVKVGPAEGDQKGKDDSKGSGAD
jgi:HlyD family secretion protein